MRMLDLNEAFRWLVFLSVVVVALASFGRKAAAEQADDTVAVESSDAITESDMSQKRGAGGNYVTSNQTLTSTSTGNVMNVSGDLTNGSVVVGNNFGGSGFGSYVMNTGNNATISSGVSLSVLMMQ